MGTNNLINAKNSGIQVYDGLGSFLGRAITAGPNISVSNGDGVSGNPVLSYTGTGTLSAPESVNFVDDFLQSGGGAAGSGYVIRGVWSNYHTGGSMFFEQLDASSGRPGVITLNTLSTAGTSSFLIVSQFTSSGGGSFVLGGGTLTVKWYVKQNQLGDANNHVNFRIGISDSTGSSAIPNNGCYFSYVDNVNSGNWQINNASGGVTNTKNTTTAGDTNWHEFKIVVNAGATSVSYYIDNVEVSNSPHTTNIPTTGISAFVNVSRSTGNAVQEYLLDLCSIQYDLTTPR